MMKAAAPMTKAEKNYRWRRYCHFDVRVYYRGEWVEFTGHFDRAGIDRWIATHLEWWRNRPIVGTAGPRRFALFEKGIFKHEI